MKDKCIIKNWVIWKFEYEQVIYATAFNTVDEAADWASNPDRDAEGIEILDIAEGLEKWD